MMALEGFCVSTFILIVLSLFVCVCWCVCVCVCTLFVGGECVCACVFISTQVSRVKPMHAEDLLHLPINHHVKLNIELIINHAFTTDLISYICIHHRPYILHTHSPETLYTTYAFTTDLIYYYISHSTKYYQE